MVPGLRHGQEGIGSSRDHLWLPAMGIGVAERPVRGARGIRAQPVRHVYLQHDLLAAVWQGEGRYRHGGD